MALFGVNKSHRKCCYIVASCSRKHTTALSKLAPVQLHTRAATNRSAGGLLELVLRPNLSILAPGNLGTPPKARHDLAENSRNFAFYESALLRKLDRM